MDAGDVYADSSAGAFRQGEILVNIVQLARAPAGAPPASQDELALQPITHPYAVVLSQDCDLEQDFKLRSGDHSIKPDKDLPNILLCMAETASAARARAAEQGAGLQWKRIHKNIDERWQFLQSWQDAAGAEPKIPALVMDFKKYFTVPTHELYGAEVVRLGRLVSPYLEHLASRFARYLSRVALPVEHRIED